MSMIQPPLTQEQFRHALARGKGRALAHVREYGHGGLREDILEVCLTNHTFDPGYEEYRVPWLLDILDLTGEPGHYKAHILAALGRAREPHDADQLFEFALEYALGSSEDEPCPKARKAIYDAFKAQRFEQAHIGGGQVIYLDGAPGLVRVAKTIGNRLLHESGYRQRWFGDYLISDALADLGENEVLDTLAVNASLMPGVRAFLDEVLLRMDERENGGPHALPEPGFGELLAAAADPQGSPFTGYDLAQQGARARRRDRSRLAARLAHETRPEVLAGLCWIASSWRDASLVPAFMDLALSGHPDLSLAAFSALGEMDRADIRAFGLKLLTERRDLLGRGLLRLFVSNCHPGDMLRIEAALHDPGDAHDLHAMCSDINALAEAFYTQEIKGCLVFAYEMTPCAHCRTQAVKNLVRQEVAPPELLQECLDDCSQTTRDLASAVLDGRRDEVDRMLEK